MDMLDDGYILYREEDAVATFKKTCSHLGYDNGSEKIRPKNKLEDLPKLFGQASRVLATVPGTGTANSIIE